MNEIYNPIIFYLTATILILFAVLAIKFENIFYSLLSAIVVFFFTGFLFYILGSEYNAVIQVAIYGVAVPVILGLAVMFSNIKNNDKLNIKKSNLRYIMFLTGGLFVLALSYLVMTSKFTSSFGFTVSEEIINTNVQVMTAFSKGLFIDYIWALELVAIILTVIVIGITLLDKKEEVDK